MKKIMYLLAGLLLFTGITSCEDRFEEANTNHNKIYTVRLQDFGRSVAGIAGSKQQACDKDRQVSCARYTLGLVHWSMFLVAGKRHPTPPGLCGEVYSIVTSFVMSDHFSTWASSILISCRLICNV